MATRIIELIRDEEIRDTITHRGAKLLDCRGRRSDLATIDVNNGCDQSVTIEIVSGNANDPGGAGASGLSYTVAAATREPIFVDALGPFTGITAIYASAPTSGKLTADMSIEVDETETRFIRQQGA